MTAIERSQRFAGLRIEILARLSRLKATANAAGEYGGRQALLLRADRLAVMVATGLEESTPREPFEKLADSLELAVESYVKRSDPHTGRLFSRYSSVLIQAQARRVRLLVSTMQPAIDAEQRPVTREEREEWQRETNQNTNPTNERPQWISI